MFVIWRKIAEAETLAIAENIWAGRYTNFKVAGSEDVTIILTSLTEVCHQYVMLKDQKVFLVKRLLMGVVLMWYAFVYVGNY